MTSGLTMRSSDDWIINIGPPRREGQQGQRFHFTTQSQCNLPLFGVKEQFAP